MEHNKIKKIIRVASFWGIFAVVIGGMIFGMVKIASRNPADSKLSLASAVVDSDWVKGNREAKVVITEYSDFQCPACAAYHPIVKQLSRDFGDNIAIVYRHFPLKQIHINAESSALAAEAAGRQGKFWEMHDMLFDGQKDWAENKKAKEIFTGYAKELGLDVLKFNEDANSKELKAKVESDYGSGVKARVDHTPTFFINGKEIQNPESYEEFKDVINEAQSQDK